MTPLAALTRRLATDGAPDVVARVVAHRYAPRDVHIRRLLAAADVASLVAGLVAMAVIAALPSSVVTWGALTAPAWIVLFNAYRLYDRDLKRIAHSSVDDIPWVAHAVLVGSLLMWGYYRAGPGLIVDFSDLLVFGTATAVAVPVARAIARAVGVATLSPERVLFIGDGPQVEVVARKMRAHREYELEPVGVLGQAGSATGPAGVPVLGRLGEAPIEQLVEAHHIERVVVAHSDLGEAAMLEVLRRCRELHVKVSVLPQLFDVLGSSVQVDDVEGVTMLGIVPPVFPRSSRWVKRGMDIAGAAALLLATGPLLAAVAVAIRLDSPGPALFRQQRIGRCGRPFQLVKFRTMVVDAEARREALMRRSRSPQWLDLECDPRTTGVGRFLRLSSLDELPQLWNVLRGEMSLVGPRPLIEAEDRQLEGWRRSRVDLTPGLTGLWQVLGRTRIAFDEMVKLDYLYVTNWSLWTDIGLILRTVPVVFFRRGAN